MENKTIEEFNIGETIQGHFLVRAMLVKTANNNRKYVDFTLGDSTGEINAKLWDYDENKDPGYSENTLVKVRGQVNEWHGRKQLRINKIRKTTAQDNVSAKDFVPVAPYEPEFMMGEILKYVIKIRNRDIKEIVSRALNEKQEKLLHYPAAMKNHHSIRSGLLYHTMTMLTLAQKLSEVYTKLNRDLLYAGVILHDLEKIDEMDASELGVVSSYTMEGMLLGHIVQGVKMLERIGRDVGADREIIILLQHMILSHHYEPEFGSPKRPMIPEAEILHHLDIIDASMYDMEKALGETQKGEFSERVWSLHNRQLYHYILEDEREAEINTTDEAEAWDRT